MSKRVRRYRDKEKEEMARHSFSQLVNSNKEKAVTNKKQRAYIEYNKDERVINNKNNQRQKQGIPWTDEESLDSSESGSLDLLNIFNTPRTEIRTTQSHLERYNIICLFDVEFTYTKKRFTLLSTEQMRTIKNEWNKAEESIRQETIQESWTKCSLKKQVDIYFNIIEGKTDKDTFFIDLFTAFTRQPSDEYQHRRNYEIFWCQDLYRRMTLQFIRSRSVLKDKTASEFRYRDELVNHLLSAIFYDVEDTMWIDTGEIENNTRKRQRNFSKADNERERLGDKHDGVLYMNVHGSKVEVGFFEVVGNALIISNSGKNDDLTKLLKAMMISLRYQRAYSENTNSLNLQSFAILVYGCEYHFLSMHFINNKYVVDEFDAFNLPNSSACFSEIGSVVEIVKKFKIRMMLYYRKLIERPRKVTWLSSMDLPTASPPKPKKSQ